MLLPFHIGASGGVAITRDVDRQIVQRVITVVGTEPSERVMMPHFGVPVLDFLFEAGASIVSAELSDNTREQMAMWEPGVLVSSVSPLVNDDKAIAAVDIKYIRTDAPDSPDSVARSVHTMRIDRNGRTREVLRG